MMHWKCLIVFKNSCNLKTGNLSFLSVLFASILLLCTLCIALFLPVCVFDATIREQRFNIDMLEDSLMSQTSQPKRHELLEKKLRNNISSLSQELRQVRATLRIYESLGQIMEKDSSLATFGNKRHQNVLITSLRHSGEIILGDLFNQHRDVFYLFEPFHSLEYYREKRPPDVYNTMLRSFLQGIFSCDFTNMNFYTEYLSHHYKALIHRLASRVLSSPPLCPDVKNGIYYNIRQCSHLRPPTLNAICKLYDYTVVKTTQLVDLERLTHFQDGTRVPLRVVELVRDPRAVLYTQLGEIGNMTQPWLAKEAKKICTQHLRNRHYMERSEVKQNNRFTTVKYEDLVSEPAKVFENICNALGLSNSKHAKSWSDKILQEGFLWPMFVNVEGMEKKITKKFNVTQSISEWQRGLDLWQIRSIERECFTVMELLEYTIYKQNDR